MTTTNDSIRAAEYTAEAWRAVIWGDRPEGAEHVVEYEGTVYIVITGTGDCDGGGFAFEADDVDRWLESDSGESEEAYQRFCDSVSPEEDEDLARAVYLAVGVKIFRAGACVQILTDAQLAVLRDPEAAIEARAAEDAREAIRQGATAPWGEGETIAPGCHDGLFELLGRHYTSEEAATYDVAFRETIDAEAPEA